MEIRNAVKKIKLKKAAGIDGIPMEAWKFTGKELWKKFVELIGIVGREGAISEDWKKSAIVPIHKRGDQEEARSYRGISLICTAYKIYTEILRNRIEAQVEEEGMILRESQRGFRKEKSTMDNVFVLNHLAQRVGRDGGKEKVYALFADLKAVFDKMNKLWEIMREKGIQEILIRRVEKIYEETEVAVKMGQGHTKEYKTRGVRQGCVLT